MVGVYIITRMISFLSRKGDREESLLVKGLAIITILTILVCITDLLMKGVTTP
jgi:hypothetical protein